MYCLSGHTETIPVVTGSRFGRTAQARHASEGLYRSLAMARSSGTLEMWSECLGVGLERSEMVGNRAGQNGGL